jgi:hypothetical protein
MLRIRRDEGATTAEYVAVLLLVALLVAALLASGLTPAVAEGLRRALCQLFTGGQCPGVSATPSPEELNRMGLPCLTRRDVADMGFSVLVKGVQWDRGAGYTVEQLGTGTFRVTLFAHDALGAGMISGDGPGSLGKKKTGDWGWIRGRYGAGSVTAGGRASMSYDFKTREEAEAFAQGQRGGYKLWLHTAAGAQGHVITQGWEWLKRKVTGDEGPEPSFTSVQLNLRAQGRIGYNGGWLGARGGATGVQSGVLTRIHLNGWTVFTASLDGAAGAGGSVLFFSGDASVGGAARYRVLFDENRQPLRFVAVRESGYTGKLGVDAAGVRQKQSDTDRGGGGGVAAGYSDSQVFIEETNLDLRDPTNRAAFERAFDYVPGVIAVPRIDDGDAMTAFGDQVKADGVKVDLEYDETAPSAGVGGVVVGRGLYGFIGSGERINRDLVSATILDPRWANPEPRRFESCWTDEGGAGVPSGGGSPGDGPGQGP